MTPLLDTCRLLLASALAWAGTPAWGAPPPAAPSSDALAAASAPARRAGCPTPAASSPRDAGRPSSKLRHRLDEDAACPGTQGLGPPLATLPAASGPAATH